MITLKQERPSSGVKLSLAWRLDQEMRINIYENSRASILEKLHHLPSIKKVSYMARHFNHR